MFGGQWSRLTERPFGRGMGRWLLVKFTARFPGWNQYSFIFIHVGHQPFYTGHTSVQHCFPFPDINLPLTSSVTVSSFFPCGIIQFLKQKHKQWNLFVCPSWDLKGKSAFSTRPRGVKDKNWPMHVYSVTLFYILCRRWPPTCRCLLQPRRGLSASRAAVRCSTWYSNAKRCIVCGRGWHFLSRRDQCVCICVGVCEHLQSLHVKECDRPAACVSSVFMCEWLREQSSSCDGASGRDGGHQLWESRVSRLSDWWSQDWIQSWRPLCLNKWTSIVSAEEILQLWKFDAECGQYGSPRSWKCNYRVSLLV